MAKDACYSKVKSRYKVFPSAYASGAIAKCRKVGVSNWGNSKKKTVGGVVTTNPTGEKLVMASNGAMVPKSELKVYEQSIKQARKELAKERVASTYKQTMFNPVFTQVAGAALLAPIQALNYGRNIIRTAKGVKKINAVNKTKKTLKAAETANTGYGTYQAKYGGY